MKGSLQDIGFLLSMLFGFMFAVAIAWPIATQFFDSFHQVAPTSEINNILTSTTTRLQEGISAMDMFLPVLFIILSVISFAAASQVRSHPAFFVVFFLINVLTIFFAGFLQEMWANIDTAGSQMLVWTPLFLQWAPKITVGLMLLMAIAVWVKG